jgi:hypothetical protein
MFLLSDRITLGTEATYYLRYIRDTTKLTSMPDSKQKSSEFVLTVPVVLVLSIRFLNHLQFVARAAAAPSTLSCSALV